MSTEGQLLPGMDNTVMVLYFLVMAVFLYILWIILAYILERRVVRSESGIGNARVSSENEAMYRNVDEQEECSICYERIKYKVQLDCRHNFCGRCIINYYSTLIPSSLTCPLCRSTVRLINFDNIERTERTRDFYDEIVRYNHRNLTGWNYVKYITHYV